MWDAVGPLSGVGGTAANGAAVVQYQEGGVYSLQLQLNVAPVPRGSSYVGWLVADGVEPLQLGTLQSPSGDARHSLTFSSSRDLRSASKVVVTLERGVEVTTPGTPVAEGRLTVSTK